MPDLNDYINDFAAEIGSILIGYGSCDDNDQLQFETEEEGFWGPISPDLAILER